MPAGKLRLFVSNNDRQVRVFDMPSMRRVDTICCPAPVNYSSLSPKGDLLACVGDSEETHLYRAGPSGNSLHPCAAVCALKDLGELVARANHVMSLTRRRPADRHASHICEGRQVLNSASTFACSFVPSDAA